MNFDVYGCKACGIIRLTLKYRPFSRKPIRNDTDFGALLGLIDAKSYEDATNELER